MTEELAKFASVNDAARGAWAVIAGVVCILGTCCAMSSSSETRDYVRDSSSTQQQQHMQHTPQATQPMGKEDAGPRASPLPQYISYIASPSHGTRNSDPCFQNHSVPPDDASIGVGGKRTTVRSTLEIQLVVHTYKMD